MSKDRKPGVGEIVHFVCPHDDAEFEEYEGMHVPLIVISRTPHAVFDNFKVNGFACSPGAGYPTFCWQDEEQQLPGSWHYKENCDWEPEGSGD